MQKIFQFLMLFIPVSTNLNGEGSVCGRSHGNSFHVQEKIVGGYDIGYYKYPWFAVLLKDDFVNCAGSLIDSKTILTAAHCYHEYLNSSKKIKLEDIYTVGLGFYNKCEKEKTQKHFTVEKTIIHEDYKQKWPYYDIAILILKENTSLFEPICLPKNIINPRPREGTAPGLGTLKYQGKTPCTVHEARLLIYSDEECKRMINKTENDASKLYKALCAGYLEGGIDTCQGDSGGPLQVTDDYGNFYLLGIVSYGFECALRDRLGVYTDASQYIPWIEEKTGVQTTLENGTTSSSNSTVVPITRTQSSVLSTTSSTKAPSVAAPTSKTTPEHLVTSVATQTFVPGVRPPHRVVYYPNPYYRPPVHILIFKKGKVSQVKKAKQRNFKGKSRKKQVKFDVSALGSKQNGEK